MTVKSIAIVVCAVQVTSHSWRAHMSSSLRSPHTSLHSKVGSCLSLLRMGPSPLEGREVLRKCCQVLEHHGLPSKSQGPDEMLPTAERNVETCSRGGGIALGRHSTHSIEESGWKVCRENQCNLPFPQWMHFAILVYLEKMLLAKMLFRIISVQMHFLLCHG